MHCKKVLQACSRVVTRDVVESMNQRPTRGDFRHGLDPASAVQDRRLRQQKSKELSKAEASESESESASCCMLEHWSTFDTLNNALQVAAHACPHEVLSLVLLADPLHKTV